MADMTMKKFLTEYYRRMIFREMSHEELLQFGEYIDKKKLTDEQKIWADELLAKDATGAFEKDPSGTVYAPKNLPDAAEDLKAGELKKIYEAFQEAFQSMDSSKAEFAGERNPDAKKFFEKYFGAGKLFGHTKARPTAELKIRDLREFLKRNRNKLEDRFTRGYGVFDKDFTYEEFLQGLEDTDRKYNTNAKFRNKLLSVASFIESYKYSIREETGIDMPDLYDYDKWFEQNVSDARLSVFQKNLPELLNELRKKPKVRNVFAAHDGGAITSHLNKALEGMNYRDPKSDNYIQPKREDRLSVTERISEWWGNTYTDCIEKYAKLRGDELYFSNEVKNICKYLKKDLKQTDGLDGVLKNISTTKEKLKEAREFKSIKHLEWFEKVLGEIKSDPNCKKIWSGALRNGRKMRALAQEVIIRSVNEGKVAEAETALELISVLHYGYTTSKIMEKLGTEFKDFSFFSDPNLSWNKNESVQLISRALDKTIKVAFMGVGYGITVAGNAIRLSGSKIKRYTDKKGYFKKEHDEYTKKMEDDKQRLTETVGSQRKQLKDLRRDIRKITGGSISKKKIDEKKAELLDELNTEGPDTSNLVTLCNQHPEWLDTVDNFLSNVVDDPDSATVQSPYDDSTKTPEQESVENDILQEIEAVKDFYSRKKEIEKKYNDLTEGAELLKELKEQYKRNKEQVENWDANHVDEMEKLVSLWNRLETGRNTKTGPMYNWFRYLNKKKAQENLVNNKEAIMTQWMQSHKIND